MPSPLSIAVVAPLVAPLAPAQPYGNHVFLADLARGLAARGHRVVVYAAAGSRVDGVTLVTVPVDAAARQRFLLLRDHDAAASRAMARAFDRVFARVARAGHDAVSQHAFDREAIERAPALATLHTLHLPPIVPDVVAAVARCDAALCSVSAHCAASWRDATGRDVLALRNGVPPLAHTGTRVPGPPFALVAGRISREKGIAAALRVARRAGLATRLFGEAYDRAYFDAEVAPLAGADVRVCASVPRDALRGVMARAHVVLMPVEWDEPFGLVAAEALMAGCPVVGYARGALREIVRDGIDGFLVNPGDEDALVDALGRVGSLARAGIGARARRRFAMAACVDRYDAALRALAAGAPLFGCGQAGLARPTPPRAGSVGMGDASSRPAPAPMANVRPS